MSNEYSHTESESLSQIHPITSEIQNIFWWGRFLLAPPVCMYLCVRVVCKGLMTLPPFVRVTASSEASSRRRRSCKAEDGLIVTNKAWCAKHDDGLYLLHRHTSKFSFKCAR